MVQATSKCVPCTTSVLFSSLIALLHTDTAFKQQRLKAWQPILTPKVVLPTLFLLGIIFAPIGAVIVWGSGKVTTITLDYTECDANAPTDGTFANMPGSAYDCMSPSSHSIHRLTNTTDDLSTSSSISSSSITSPSWSFTNVSSRPVGERAQCVIQFEVPYDLGEYYTAIRNGSTADTIQDQVSSCTTSLPISAHLPANFGLTSQLPEPPSLRAKYGH